jgi:uncharacterized membrane protein
MQARSRLVPVSQLVLFIIALAGIFYVLFQTIYKTPYTATLLYFEFASHIMHGDLPYRDFNLEYPPLSLAFFLVPRLFTDLYPAYVVLYKAEIFLFVLIGLTVFYRTARRLGLAPWNMMLVYTLGILAIGPIITEQYDLFPAILVLLAMYYFWLDKYKTSWMFLALGFMTKAYPLVIAPIFMIYHLRNRQLHRIGTAALTFVLTCLVVLLPFLFSDPTSLLGFIHYHTARGIQIESTYGAVLLAAHKLGLTSINLVFNYGSWNIAGTIADRLAVSSTYFLVAMLLAGYGLIYKSIAVGKLGIEQIGAHAVLITTITLIGSKILSPQYLVWLIPVTPLFFFSWRDCACLLFLLIGGLTFYVFPMHYMEIMDFKPGVITVLFIRDFLLIFFGIMSTISVFFGTRLIISVVCQHAEGHGEPDSTARFRDEA